MIRSEVHLSELVREILKEMNEAEPEREINIRIDEVISARCDQRLIRIVLQNLLDNAWKFTCNTEFPKITFGSTEVDGKPTYFVRDNGAGFDMKHKEKLFTPFQRLHTSGEFEGSGIGLATVQRIINRHGGLIWAESTLDEGSTFYFTLPD
jgi:light-regulated signal transduction histidine kinase (bacteriophytochrome)